MPVSVATPERLPAPTTVDAPPAAGCAACPHPDADHDAISTRFCAATVASALDRGCICSTG